MVNLPDRVVEIHGEAAGATYGHTVAARPGDVTRLRAFPDVEIAVSDILR